MKKSRSSTKLAEKGAGNSQQQQQLHCNATHSPAAFFVHRCPQQGKSATSVRADSFSQQSQGSAVTNLSKVGLLLSNAVVHTQTAVTLREQCHCCLYTAQLVSLHISCCLSRFLQCPMRLVNRLLMPVPAAALSRSFRLCGGSLRPGTMMQQSSAWCRLYRHLGTVQGASRRAVMMRC